MLRAFLRLCHTDGMPAKKHLPEQAIVDCYTSDINATPTTLAPIYGCSRRTILAILDRFIEPSLRDTLNRQKIAHLARQRPDHRTEAHRHWMAHLNTIHGPEARAKEREALTRGSIASANKRRGVPLSEEHRRKSALGHLGVMAGAKHPNWRSGTSRICWRGTGWAEARREARRRDGNRCRICAKTHEEQGRAMDVHHRISYFSFKVSAEANVLSKGSPGNKVSNDAPIVYTRRHERVR